VRVEVVPYDERWPVAFAALAEDLRRALAGVEVVGVEHVGSTSVPGLAAKPILDVDVVVAAAHVAPAIAALEAAGYVSLGDLGIPERFALRAPDDGVRRNVYVVVEGSLALRNHLGVRDVLRRDGGLRDAYGEHKRRLAERDYDDIDGYIADKSEVLQQVLEAAGIDDDERRVIDAVNRPADPSPPPTAR
jgi:GrpB-like predicted nucleotidyltransferase (UPF0157 family)